MLKGAIDYKEFRLLSVRTNIDYSKDKEYFDAIVELIDRVRLYETLTKMEEAADSEEKIQEPLLLKHRYS